MAGERYVEIALEQMDNLLIGKCRFERYTEAGTDEYLYDRPIIFADGSSLPMRIRVYSSVLIGTGRTRDNGEDSIKIMLVNDRLSEEERRRNPRGIPLKKEALTYRRVYRTKSALENLFKAVDDMFPVADLLSCPHCGSALALREGQFGKFYSCSQFRVTGCSGKKSYQQVHP